MTITTISRKTYESMIRKGWGFREAKWNESYTHRMESHANISSNWCYMVAYQYRKSLVPTRNGARAA